MDGYVDRDHAVASGLMPKTAETDLFFKASGPNRISVFYGEGGLPAGYDGPMGYVGETSIDRLEQACTPKPEACHFRPE